MNTFVKWIGYSVLLIGPMAWAQDAAPEWAIGTAPARFVIEMDQTDKPMPVSWVTLCLPDPNWAHLPLRVFNDDGNPVGSDLIWTAPGEPTTLMFDSSSNSRQYKVYMGATNWPPLHIAHPNSGVLLESRPGDGKSINHLPDMLQAWSLSKPILGRALIDGLFEGGNRFGPEAPLFTYFQGWFDVAAQEHLELATVSNDASFVLVDGKEVVEWPGLHDWQSGIKAEHNGAVDLAPGTHLLEYYNAYVPDKDRNRPLLACAAANGGALTQWTMLRPESNFFRPAGHAHVVDYNTTEASGLVRIAPFAIDWTIAGQSVIAPDVADVGLISVQLTCRPQTNGTVTWFFDDGTTAEGASVTHLFPRPGLRVVKLSVKDGANNLGAAIQTISVHPNWAQLNTVQPQLLPDHLAEMLKRDPTLFSASDLAGCVAVFATFKNTDGLLKVLPAIDAKMKDVGEADLPYMKTASIYLADEDLAHYAVAGKFLQALVDRCTMEKPSPVVIAVGNVARLALAKVKLRTSDHADEIKSLLDGINVPALTGNEPRTYAILRADLALAMGDVSGARKQYETATGTPSGPDARSSIRRTARVEQARAFLDKKDFEAAQDALSDVAWQEPISEISPDWALTQLRLYQEEGYSDMAFIWALRLLPVITDEGRSELLLRLTDLSFAQAHDDMAKKALAELLKKYPYSPEAAQAKGKWPDKI